MKKTEDGRLVILCRLMCVYRTLEGRRSDLGQVAALIYVSNPARRDGLRRTDRPTRFRRRIVRRRPVIPVMARSFVGPRIGILSQLIEVIAGRGDIAARAV